MFALVDAIAMNYLSLATAASQWISSVSCREFNSSVSNPRELTDCFSLVRLHAGRVPEPPILYQQHFFLKGAESLFPYAQDFSILLFLQTSK